MLLLSTGSSHCYSAYYLLEVSWGTCTNDCVLNPRKHMSTEADVTQPLSVAPWPQNLWTGAPSNREQTHGGWTLIAISLPSCFYEYVGWLRRITNFLLLGGGMLVFEWYPRNGRRKEQVRKQTSSKDSPVNMDLGDNPASLQSSFKQQLCERVSLFTRKRKNWGSVNGILRLRGGSVPVQGQRK